MMVPSACLVLCRVSAVLAMASIFGKSWIAKHAEAKSDGYSSHAMILTKPKLQENRTFINNKVFINL